MRIREQLPALGLLAMLSAPISGACQDAAPAASARDAVTEALQGGAAAKLAVAEHFAKTHEWAGDGAAIGFEAPQGLPAEVTVAGGTITFTFSRPEDIAGKTLRLVPSDGGGGMVRWRCEAPDLPAEAVPEACR